MGPHKPRLMWSPNLPLTQVGLLVPLPCRSRTHDHDSWGPALPAGIAPGNVLKFYMAVIPRAAWGPVGRDSWGPKLTTDPARGLMTMTPGDPPRPQESRSHGVPI